MISQVRVGTAGWAIPRTVAERFPAGGSGLARYTARFKAAEINSSFYRSHRPATWARWRESTPDGFKFAVKAPKAVTHEARLADTGQRMAGFLAEVRQLDDRLGPLLIQLPPSLAFEDGVAAAFFADLRSQHRGPVACEPRHPSWFEAAADALLAAHRVARVAADPARHPVAGEPGGWRGLAYWRLHGSPRMYYSSYEKSDLAKLAATLAESPADEVWCVFDNTTSGAAAANALELKQLLNLQGAAERQESCAEGPIGTMETMRQPSPNLRST
jgi:uncharacterized protein YecE (DUF72 family)